MKILLFGITNVGKTTIGKLLSEKLNYDFDDLDDEIKRRYGKIDNFLSKYPYDYARHRKRGEILKEVIDKYEDNVVIAVSPIYYEEFLVEVLNENNVLAIEIQDEPENVLKRLVYADENDNVFPIQMNTEKEKQYYLNDIKADIKYYEKVYEKNGEHGDIQSEFKEIMEILLKKSASQEKEIFLSWLKEYIEEDDEFIDFKDEFQELYNKNI